MLAILLLGGLGKIAVEGKRPLIIILKLKDEQPAPGRHRHGGHPLFRVVYPADALNRDEAGSLPVSGMNQRFIQLQGKGEIAHRLEQKIQRVHLIAPNGVLAHIGDEEDHRLVVQLPDPI